MNALERRSVAALATLYCFRMLGLFMVLPLLSLYVDELQGATPVLLGLAMGIYGLSQALLQIPLGMLSDRVGRLPVILGGLAVFALGSFLAAQAETIHGVLLGRFLQGAGAISSTVLALVADLTRDDQRTKAMALIGMSIGLSFTIALIVGPLLASRGGLGLIFEVTGGLALVGMAIAAFGVPRARRVALHGEVGTVPGLLSRTLADTHLLRLNGSVFALHFILMACFVGLPLVLEGQLGVSRTEHWKIYLPALLLSLFGMFMLITLAERRRRLRLALGLGICGIAASPLLTGGGQGVAGFFLGLCIFFMGFNYLEASLPSLVSKAVYAGGKGTALGVYSTFQFLGAFAGGWAGGLALQSGGVPGVLALASIAALLWLPVALSLRQPEDHENRVIRLPDDPAQREALLARLGEAEGVADMLVLQSEDTAYLKVNAAAFDASFASMPADEGGGSPRAVLPESGGQTA